MVLSMEAGTGDLRLYMSGDRAKLDMSMLVNPLPAPIKIGVLLDAKTPKIVWLVNDNLKTYSYLNLADSPAAPDTSAAGKYVIKELGKQTLLGYACTHLTLTRKGELVDAVDHPGAAGRVRACSRNCRRPIRNTATSPSSAPWRAPARRACP